MFIKTRNFGPHGNRFRIKSSCFPHEGVSGNKSLYIFLQVWYRITNSTFTHEVKSSAEKGLEICIS